MFAPLLSPGGGGSGANAAPSELPVWKQVLLFLLSLLAFVILDGAWIGLVAADFYQSRLQVRRNSGRAWWGAPPTPASPAPGVDTRACTHPIHLLPLPSLTLQPILKPTDMVAALLSWTCIVGINQVFVLPRNIRPATSAFSCLAHVSARECNGGSEGTGAGCRM
jgi:hypothetical protein